MSTFNPAIDLAVATSPALRVVKPQEMRWVRRPERSEDQAAIDAINARLAQTRDERLKRAAESTRALTGKPQLP